MGIHISEGNSKLGKIPNISLPPGKSCIINAPCLRDGCYARKFYRLYPSCKQAWDENLKYYQESPADYFKEIGEYIQKKKPRFFRWHVAGDIPDVDYLSRMRSIALSFPGTNFLCFTKRYSYDFSNLPDNLTVLLSTWPTSPVPVTELPKTWLSQDPRKPNAKTIKCPGNCLNCGHVCWDAADLGTDIVFDKH